eukprot:Blabericola_migrator_1__884@NODE_1217_length_5093_cov_73_346797_g826_i0_p3_GENE_NODE_1217_length_5093_cov_73_346797_g826_i0NODE_1217_length_5093_cov_73_346797_g826_i0_p3_ORF_typecomplete_len322_score20_99_NODE_1217_length_5093_cov_73_346797_g826_i039004865
MLDGTSSSGIIFIATTGAESALCLVALCTGHYSTFIPTIFPVVLAITGIIKPFLVVFALSAVLHILGTLLLVLSLITANLSSTPWNLGKTIAGKEVTVFTVLALMNNAVVSIVLTQKFETHARLSWWKVAPDYVVRQLRRLREPHAQATIGKTNGSPRAAAVEDSSSVILELPESLLNTPRTESQKHLGAQHSPTSMATSSPFAALMAQPVSNRNSTTTSPCMMIGQSKLSKELPMLYSPYSSPQERTLPWPGQVPQLAQPASPPRPRAVEPQEVRPLPILAHNADSAMSTMESLGGTAGRNEDTRSISTSRMADDPVELQ